MRNPATSRNYSYGADARSRGAQDFREWVAAARQQRDAESKQINPAGKFGDLLRPNAGSGPQRALRHYRLGFQIAYGGTAAVHLGVLEGPGGIARPVAMKRIRPGVPKEREFRAALSAEARLGCFVRHPNVIPILDLFESDGELLLVMEYVVGETLARLQRCNAVIPVAIAVSIMSGILRGLHAAHTARGNSDESLRIVHRDVSPQNVLVGEDGIARIIDFGMASATSNEPTQPGYVKGKIGYLAPEQVTNDRLDARTDVFAAGIVLWEALTGKRLFRGENPVADVLRFMSEPLRKVSDSNPDVPRQLDSVLARALRARPEQRFDNAEEFAEALERARRPASPSEVARYLKSQVGLSIEMQRTLVSGLSTQKAPHAFVMEGPQEPSSYSVMTTIRVPPSAPKGMRPRLATLRDEASSVVARALHLDEKSGVRTKAKLWRLPFAAPRAALAIVFGLSCGVAATVALHSRTPARVRVAAATATAAAPARHAPVAQVEVPATVAPTPSIVAATIESAAADNGVIFETDPSPSAETLRSNETASTAPERSKSTTQRRGHPAPRSHSSRHVKRIASAAPPAKVALSQPKPIGGSKVSTSGSKLANLAPRLANAAPKKATCEPPYYFDGKSIKRLKRECL